MTDKGIGRAKGEEIAILRAVAGLVLRSGAPNLHARLLASLLLIFIAKGFGVVGPLFLGYGVNQLAAGQSLGVQTLLVFAAIVVGWQATRFLSQAAPFLCDLMFAPVTFAAQNRASIETFDHALALSLEFHQSKQSGALVRIIDRGSRAVEVLIRNVIFTAGPSIVETIAAAAVLTRFYDWRYAAVALFATVGFAISTQLLANWRMAFRRTVNDVEGEAAGWTMDALINHEMVKAFGAERRTVAGYTSKLERWAAASITAQNATSVMGLIQVFVLIAGMVAMTILAGSGVIAGQIGPGDLTAAILMLLNLFQPVAMLGGAYREIRQAFVDMEAMLDLQKTAIEIAEPEHPAVLPTLDPTASGEVRFTNIRFQHTARSQGLRGVSFAARAGKTTAIVGPSGAGKTTLIRLALRLIDPQEGQVSLDGVDLRDLSHDALHRALALVPQDVALFNATLAENIGFGNPEADRSAIEAAAAAAELAVFLTNLPEGLETKVGERGLKLSGGERQRVGLARALLADPRVLVLDEATSALDGRTEAAIQATLVKARAGRTTIVVAHRLSTIADADHIVVLANGRVVEEGRHQDLLDATGEYAALWKRQARA
jgi:ABC-type transport system involved in Fe-S cluster assembly fused permease/ATPase subunit